MRAEHAHQQPVVEEGGAPPEPVSKPPNVTICTSFTELTVLSVTNELVSDARGAATACCCGGFETLASLAPQPAAGQRSGDVSRPGLAGG